MATEKVSINVEQGCIIKFLEKEKVKPAEILSRLQVQIREHTQ